MARIGQSHRNRRSPDYVVPANRAPSPTGVLRGRSSSDFMPQPPGFSSPEEERIRQAQRKEQLRREGVLQYLAPVEQGQYIRALEKSNVARKQAELTYKRASRLIELSKQGPDGVRVVQGLLSQAGYRVAVDGVYGPQTESALRDYTDTAVAGLRAAPTTQSTFVNFKQKREQQLQPQAVNERAFIQQQADRWIEKLQQTIAAARKTTPGRVDSTTKVPGTDDVTVRQLEEQVQSWYRVKRQSLDPINGFNNAAAIEVAQQIRDADAVIELEGERRTRELANINQQFSRLVAEARQNNDTARERDLRRQWREYSRTAAAAPGSPEARSALGEVRVQRIPGIDTSYASISELLNKGSGALAAAQVAARRHGFFSGLQAAAGGFLSPIRVPGTDLSLVGMVAPGGTAARDAIEQTNTEAERQALVEAGDLLSFGQVLTGRVTEEYAAKHGKLRGLGVPFTDLRLGGVVIEGDKFDLISAIADIALIPAKDPTIFFGAALKPITKVGEFAGEQAVRRASKETLEEVGEAAVRAQGRRLFLDQNAIGQRLSTLIDEALSDVTRTGNLRGIQRAFPGLDATTAAAALEARVAAEGGDIAARMAAAQVIQEAFVAGKWNPTVRLPAQALAYANKLGIAGERTLGRTAVVLTDRLSKIRSLAAPRGATATAFEQDAVAFVDRAVTSASKVNNQTWRSVWHASVRENVAGETLGDRFYASLDNIGKTESASLQAAAEGTLRPFFTNGELLDNVPLSTYMESVFAQEGFEEAVRKVETMVAIYSGGAGARAAAQLKADLGRGFLIADSRGLVKTASDNVLADIPSVPKKGLSAKSLGKQISALPNDVRDYFGERLSGLGTGNKNALRRLASEVAAVRGNSELREEVARLLRQAGARSDEAAEAAIKRPGLATRATQRSARFVLDLAEPVAPSEIRFTYKTQNAAMHAKMRADAVDRIASEYRLSDAARRAFLDEAVRVDTEEALFKLSERITRAGLEASGVTNVDDVMRILKERGSFKRVTKEAVGRIVDPDTGELLDSLHTLAQRVESVRIPAAPEMAQAIRRAILDGAENGTVAQRFGAKLRVLVDAAGDITIKPGTHGTIRLSVRQAHRLWKFLIVTNAGLPIVGATAGFIGEDGDLQDRLRGAGLGFTIGSLGGARYIFRVAGIEETLRKLISEGFYPDVLVPGLSKWRARRYGTDPYRRFLSDDLVRAGNYGSSHFENDLLIHVDPEWVAIPRKDTRFVDGWFRIVNHQINPESDPVMAILLREQAGHLGDETVSKADDAAALFGEAFGTPQTKLSPLEQAVKDADAAITERGAPRIGPSNDELLDRFPEGTKTRKFYRGEDAQFGVRGDQWAPTRKYAEGFAGSDGVLYEVRLPVNDAGRPLVGRAADKPDVGWLLSAADSIWADAAEPILTSAQKAAAKRAAAAAPKRVTAREAADTAIAEFLRTDEGRLWAARWKGALGGTGSTKKAVERMRKFLQTYSTRDIAEMRIAGGMNGTPGRIERDTLKRMSKEGLGPDAVHAQKTWRIPKTKELFSTAWLNYQEVIGRGVLSGPTNAINRRPMSNFLFNREYDRLVLNGVARDEAQRIADEFAVTRTNRTLFQISDESRFAQKADLFLPFQQPREEIVRVWGKLLVENPTRSIRVGLEAASIFNMGVDKGVFTKNEFTGQWQMTVPGSGRLSRALFGLPFELPFTSDIKNMLFIGQGAYGIGVLPQPGGPFWSILTRQAANQFPELFKGNNPIQKWLIPYGPGGDLLRRDNSRLWMALTGDTPPWEFATKQEWTNELNKWRIEVAKELLYQNQISGGDPDYFPSNEEVDEATSKLFTFWAFIGATFPAGAYPSLTSATTYSAARDSFTAGGKLPMDYEAFLKQYPEYEAYLSGPTTEYTGPDDTHILREFSVGLGSEEGEDVSLQRRLRLREYKTLGEWREQFKLYQRTGEYFRALENARKEPDLLDRERNISNVKNRYADVVGKLNRDYEIVAELHDIEFNYPTSMKTQALQRVRLQYNLSQAELDEFMRDERVKDSEWARSPWQAARLGVEVAAAVEARAGSDPSAPNVARYVATLPPAEQARYWQYQMNALGFSPELDDAQATLDRYAAYQKQYFAVRNAYPFLYRQAPSTNPFDELVNDVKSDINTQVGAAYTAIGRIQTEMDEAVKAKNWNAYYALKDKRTQYYDLVEALRTALYQSLPDLSVMFDDLRSASLYEAAGNAPEAARLRAQALMDGVNAPYILSSEESRFVNMPDTVKQAYITDLVNSLDMPAGQVPYDVRDYLKETYGATKLFWEYLSPLQQHVLEANMPAAAIENWKYQSDYYLRGAGKEEVRGSGGTGRGGSNVPGDLQYAYDLFKQYSKRDGMAKPPAYDEYIALPKNPAVKADFLRKHPDVADYISKGPLANMPPLYRELVVNTMIRYGKWEGEERTIEEVTDIAFAKQQLEFWNRRPTGAMAPETYYLWRDMPTGPEKAQYLREHPEVQQWIQLGPMANMPDDYKEVVRDIMQRYGEWTSTEDPLGSTIQKFFTLPADARQAFLREHPELEVYFSLTRTAEEQAMFDVQNTYFAIADVGARRAFLAAHPELQQYFLDARARRYERFLNQVAQYMGANPEMFEDYLNRQQDVLAELLRRYAEPTLMREGTSARVVTSSSGDSGRVRSQRKAA